MCVLLTDWCVQVVRCACRHSNSSCAHAIVILYLGYFRRGQVELQCTCCRASQTRTLTAVPRCDDRLVLPSTFVIVCYSWWGPVLTCSVWCPSWCLSSFPSWSSFFLSSSNSSRKCYLPPSRQSPKKQVLMYTHAHAHTHAQSLLPEWPTTGFIVIM